MALSNGEVYFAQTITRLHRSPKKTTFRKRVKWVMRWTLELCAVFYMSVSLSGCGNFHCCLAKSSDSFEIGM